MRLKVVESLRSALRSAGCPVVVDDVGARVAEELGLENVLRVDSADLVGLEKVHAAIHESGARRIVGLGGLPAVNAAKVLASPRLRGKSLREVYYDERKPAVEVLLVPLEPAYCTDLSDLVLVYDSKIPAWLVRRAYGNTYVATFAYLEEAGRSPRTRVVVRDMSLAGYSDVDPGESYVSLCSIYEGRAPGPLLIAAMTLSSILGWSLDGAVEAVAGAKFEEALKEAFEQENPESWLEKEMRLRRAQPRLWKRVDLLVEHAWTFYSLRLRSLGFRGKVEVYKLFRSLLSSLPAVGTP
ncbi:hypothetical protein [Thermofilum pendens]|uniref:Iron-containing alcohol dehydrogenase n=1 Tax=Thermofilum pendens (strain DSM 2475 / Hrk 5) TaxID=368408 RepID=A1RYM4_THEPD|nr:hypothetical protein [Thermofilum pendens]ABL78304.1 hypothetical protein Tpen_0903 [Thermofilum pendens Hrk 5]